MAPGGDVLEVVEGREVVSRELVVRVVSDLHPLVERFEGEVPPLPQLAELWGDGAEVVVDKGRPENERGTAVRWDRVGVFHLPSGGGLVVSAANAWETQAVETGRQALGQPPEVKEEVLRDDYWGKAVRVNDEEITAALEQEAGMDEVLERLVSKGRAGERIDMDSELARRFMQEDYGLERRVGDAGKLLGEAGRARLNGNYVKNYRLAWGVADIAMLGGTTEPKQREKILGHLAGVMARQGGGVTVDSSPVLQRALGSDAGSFRGLLEQARQREGIAAPAGVPGKLGSGG